MAVFRKVEIDYWQDNFILERSPKEKYFYIYLMTNTKTSQCGIYELPKKIIKLETGLSEDEIEILLNDFISFNKILYLNYTNEIMIMSWIKYNGSESPKVLTKVTKELKAIKKREFVEKYIQLSIFHGYKLDRVSILYANSIDTESQKEKEEEKEEEKAKEKEVKVETYKNSISEGLSTGKYGKEIYFDVPKNKVHLDSKMINEEIKKLGLE